MQIFDKSNNSFQLTVRDTAMQAYLQRYPFLMGPDKVMNEKCREALYQGLASRNRETTTTAVNRLMPQETLLTGEERDRLQRIMDASGVPQSLRAEMIDDYEWEANLVPRDTKDALVLGCADGIELMFLRAVLPEATITALDYEDMIPEARKKAIVVRFFHGDMNAILSTFGREFDLISSNHTLEHLYTPNEILTTLAGLLRDHGSLISTLPMDGLDGSPFLEKVSETIRNGSAHPLDVVYLDAGHPWKTNPADLVATMQESGFEKPLLYQRQEHLPRSAPFGERQLRSRLAFGRALHAIFFAAPRSLAKAIFSNPPRILNTCLLAAERRVWFGSNLLKNLHTQEVLVLARKRSDAT